MSDIGLFPAGSNALFAALLIIALALVVVVGASLQAWFRSRRLAAPLLSDPALGYAGAGVVAALLAFGLAVTASEASLETREVLDAWWLPCAAGVLAGAGLAGWGTRRFQRI